MNRRSFLLGSAAAIAAPLAPLPIIEAPAEPLWGVRDASFLGNTWTSFEPIPYQWVGLYIESSQRPRGPDGASMIEWDYDEDDEDGDSVCRPEWFGARPANPPQSS